MRVVLDANIFISALISRQGNPAKILDKWKNRESGANYIVTGDPHLLTVNEYQGIVMASPATFLALLDVEV